MVEDTVVEDAVVEDTVVDRGAGSRGGRILSKFKCLIARQLNKATRQKTDKGRVGRNAEDNIATVTRKWPSTVNVVIDTLAVNEHCSST
jgi:hypothetical protein